MQIEIGAARFGAGGGRGAHQQPLALELAQRLTLAIQRRHHGRIGHGALRLDQLAKIAAAFGAHYVIGEVRGNYRRCTYQQHGQHLPAARAHLPRFGVGHGCARARHAVHGKRERAFGSRGRFRRTAGCVGEGSVG
ncbi:hypothetical protein SDC9_206049 [bioreactor metagenome]|uniref:Uncharacterized protein n=1 Tax=bioreactor metagenome TaxID=1076179 RepID=A0A645J3Q2_9ZZZZ